MPGPARSRARSRPSPSATARTGPSGGGSGEAKPLPIGAGQTISQPEVVARMTSLVRPRRDMRVLEVGTGSGYQAAVLAECVREVDTIEIVPELGRRAEARLRELGYRNVPVRVGDGYAGWPERAPCDAIVLTAAPEQVPRPLLDQLRVGAGWWRRWGAGCRSWW